ncbi:hypothetical protein D6833_00415 [Candidatus Parcubacteria bacterium]|nr:MAG: hypothetical protein D6833_00415 [Candidatus Parcubacteria bacterium]
MGRTLLIILTGLSVSFSIFAISRNRRIVEAADQLATKFESVSATNAASSGVLMALNQLYQDDTWRNGYSNLVLNGDTISVSVEDFNTNPLLSPNEIRLLATARNQPYQSSVEALVFDGTFNGFAVWAKDTVMFVTTLDTLGVVSPDLLMQQAPFMPDIDQAQLILEAGNQGHQIDASSNPDSTFTPPSGYPNNNFYFAGQTPNVVYVQGNLRIAKNRIIYGIYLVDGDVRLDNNATVEGIVYTPNRKRSIYNSNAHISHVNGGIVSWGKIKGSYGTIEVRLVPEYMDRFVGNFVPRNPPLRVISWKQF